MRVKSDVGFGTIVGSAVFNVLFVIGLCALVVPGGEVPLTWWPLPTSHLFEGSLVAYYPFVNGTTQDAYNSWNGMPSTMAATEGRDGGSAIVLDAERRDSVTLPPEATQDVLGDADRTVCLWARIDEWKGGCLFHYGGDGSQVTSSGGDGTSCCTYCYGCEFTNCNGAATLEEVASQGLSLIHI